MRNKLKKVKSATKFSNKNSFTIKVLFFIFFIYPGILKLIFTTSRNIFKCFLDLTEIFLLSKNYEEYN